VPPFSHARFNRSDLGRYLFWFLLQGLLITVLMGLMVLLGTNSSFDIPWSLVAIAALLAVVYRRGHYQLVLGLGGAAMAAQYAPAFFGYALILTIPLFGILRWRINHPSEKSSRWVMVLYWAVLGFSFLILPWALQSIWHHQPTAWLWWHGFAAASLFILYARLGLETNPSLIRQGYFEHLAYVLFPPHRIAIVPMAPAWFGCNSRASIHFRRYRQAWRAVGMAALKTLFFLILTRLHSAPTGENETGFWAAWWYLSVHYACWLCWIQAHFDLAVALSRALGIRLPILYNRPLLALSLIKWWHRFNHLIPHLAKKAFADHANRSALHGSAVVALSYLIIPIGMVGSVFLYRDPMQFWGWLIFVFILSLGIGIEMACGHHLFHPRNRKGWTRVPFWLLTHSLLAIAHLFLLNQGYFYGDPVWQWEERWSLLLSLLPG
jgi:hypothetical protein